jgi:hypothetical protein
MKEHTTAANHRPPFEVLLDYCRDNQITHRSNIEMKLVAVSVNGAAAAEFCRWLASVRVLAMWATGRVEV